MTPEQYTILTISDKYLDYAKEVKSELDALGARGILDDRAEKIGRKIRDAEVKKIPFMLIVGEEEASAKKVSVRRQGEGDIGSMTSREFATLIEKES